MIHSSLIVFVIKRDVTNQITTVVGVLRFWICCGNLFEPYLVASKKDISTYYLG